MKNRIYFFFSIFSFLLLSFVLVFQFHIRWLPLACLLLGFLARIIFTSSYLAIFSFLIPILPAFASLENKGFPLNYLLLPIFFLGGIMAGEFAIHKGKTFRLLPELPKYYFSFMLLLGISFIFVMLRWSNLTLSSLAFFKDTPVAPTGQRLSFGIIFPVVELALFSLSPLYYLLLKHQLCRQRILIAFLSGQALSILYSLFQRWQGGNSLSLPISGLASDSTAFGFLSALAILLAWYLYFHYAEKWPGLLFATISLIGTLNSLTRVGAFVVVITIFLFIFSSRKHVVCIILIGILLAAVFFLYMHVIPQSEKNIVSRLKKTYFLIERSIETKTIKLTILRNLTAGRNVLWGYSIECLRKFLLSGAGTGNFIFWVMSAHKGEFFHHLPANQYFFISSSTGLPGMFIFLLFCLGLFKLKKWPEKWLLGIFLFLLVFNDYLWFPEIFMVFWLFASLGENGEEKSLVKSKRTKILYICGFFAFIFFNLVNFFSLHPKNWAHETATPYDYGFSYPEKEGGRKFRWSGGKAGIYVFLDNDDPRATYRLSCFAPLSRLPAKKQSVDVYWRGKFYHRVVFREQGEYLLQLNDANHSQGFLEFRVRPAFNLKEMGLGAETRNLGIQVSGPGL
jgi:hypothetical protein